MSRTERGRILLKIVVLLFLAGLVFLVYLVRHPLLLGPGLLSGELSVY